MQTQPLQLIVPIEADPSTCLHELLVSMHRPAPPPGGQGRTGLSGAPTGNRSPCLLVNTRLAMPTTGPALLPSTLSRAFAEACVV